MDWEYINQQGRNIFTGFENHEGFQYLLRHKAAIIGSRVEDGELVLRLGYWERFGQTGWDENLGAQPANGAKDTEKYFEMCRGKLYLGTRDITEFTRIIKAEQERVLRIFEVARFIPTRKLEEIRIMEEIVALCFEYNIGWMKNTRGLSHIVTADVSQMDYHEITQFFG